MTAEDSLRRLWRYKTDLEQEPDEEKLLEILHKLKRIPVSIKVLQETGIGKVINRYRKREGVVGDLASTVVTSWRRVVEQEADDSRARSPSPSHHNNSGSEEDEEGGGQSDADSWNSFKDDSNSNNNSNSGQDLEKQVKTERNRRSRREDEAHDGKFRPVQVKVEASDSYTPSKKKRLVADEKRVKQEPGSNSATTNTVTIKQEGDRSASKRSLKSDSLQQHHSKHKHHKSSKGKSHEEHSTPDSRDKHTHTRKKVDRTSKQHHLSSSEDEEQVSDGNSDGGNTEHKPAPHSGHQSRVTSSGKESGSHHHRDSSSLKKHSSSSSKHSSTSQHHSSANSHKTSSGAHKTTSSLNQQSVSPNPHEPLSVPRKESSSSKNRESSSSGSHRKPSSSGSHGHHNHSSLGVSSRHSELKISEPSQTRNHSPTHTAHSSHKKSSSPGSHRHHNHSSPAVSSRHSELESPEPSQPHNHVPTHAAHHSLNKNLVHVKKEKTDKDSSDLTLKDADQKSSKTLPLKQEAVEVKRETGTASKSSRTDLKGSSSQIAKSGSSSQKKTKHKPSFQQPDLDLFSDALHIKAEPSAADHRPKSVKKTVGAVSKPSSSSQSPSLSSRQDQPDIAIKQEPVNVFVKTEAAAVEVETPPPVASQKSKYILDEEDEEDLFADNLDSTLDRTKSLKRKLSETSVPQDNMSFEDFMNFDETAIIKKAKSAKKSSSKSTSSKTNLPETSQTTERKWSSSLSSTSTKGVTIPTPSNKAPLTEKDIMALLPETQTNYRPLWQYPEYQDEPSPAVPLVDPEMIGVKSVGRTQVYSGRKHRITEVKPLFDLCIQLLIENIDAIDCVGIIPFSILKPVFDRCTAAQLYHIEDYNPHFIEESGELWQKLAQKDFRITEQKEDESWREMYMRLLEEREHKYQKLKQNMSSSITKGQAGRKVKLAYEGVVAKPPMDVLRKQRQFGTGQVSMTKNKNSVRGSLKPYRPSLQVPVINPMEDRPRVKIVHPMMAKSIQMRRNMRR